MTFTKKISKVVRRLKTIQKRYSLSITYIASKVGVSRSTIYRWKSSQHFPHNNNLNKLKEFIKRKELEEFIHYY